MRIVIFGAPGSGKGTEARLLAEKFSLEHISTGDLLRKEIKKGSELGKEIASFIDGGNFVPDEMSFSLVKEDLKKDNFVLDGFPRTVNQARLFDDFCSADFMIFLDAEKELLVERLLKRKEKEGRKDDGSREIIERRFKIYEEKTKPLLGHYKEKMIIVDGRGSIEEVFENICKVVA